MKQLDLERWIAGYEAAVHHPEVSGMEHLQLFQVRSQLANHMQQLSVSQQERIWQADQILLANASLFLQAINEIADLHTWRSQRNTPPEDWWWYLDIIVHLPVSLLSPPAQTALAESVLV